MFELFESSNCRMILKKLSTIASITVSLFSERLGNACLLLKREQCSNDYLFEFLHMLYCMHTFTSGETKQFQNYNDHPSILHSATCLSSAATTPYGI